jgi:hypothetical protein
MTKPPDNGTVLSRFDPRNVLAVVLSVCLCCGTFVFGFLTLGLGPFVALLIYLAALLRTKSLRRKWVWCGGVLGALAFMIYGLVIRSQSQP